MATDPNIILAAGQINDPRRLAESQMAQLQLAQAQQAMRGQNALKAVFAQPGALSPNGTVSPNALAQVMRIDPQTGLDLAKQNRAAILDQLHIKAAEMGNQLSQTEIGKAKWDWMTGIAAATAESYDQAIKQGASPQMAMAKATQTRDEMIRSNGGQMSDQEEQAALSRPLNMDEARAIAAQNKSYTENRKEAFSEAEETKRDTLEENRLTEQVRHDKAEEGKPVNVGTSGLLAVPDGKGGYTFKDAMDLSGGSGTYTGGLTPRKSNGGDNPDDVVDKKIGFIAARLGVDPDKPLTPQQLVAFRSAYIQTEGSKTNNVGNLKNVSGAGFQTFPTKEAGLAAITAQISRDYARGQTSIRKLIEGVPAGGISRGQAREAVAEMVANNDIKATTAISRLPAAEREWVIARAHQINPNFDETTFNMKNAYMRGLGSSSPGTSGGQIRSLNVAVSHLNTLGILSMALKNGNVQAFNTIKQFFGREFGSAAPTNFNAVKGIVARELVKAVAGMGGGVSEQQDIAREMNNINSPAQLMGFIENQKQLMIGQLEGQRRQYEQVTGKHDFDRWLSDDTKREMYGTDMASNSGWGNFTVVRQ